MTDYTGSFGVGDSISATNTGIISAINPVGIVLQDGSNYDTTQPSLTFALVSRAAPAIGSRWSLNSNFYIFSAGGTYYCYAGPDVGKIASDIDYKRSATPIT